MTVEISTQAQRTLIQRLRQLISQRAAAEQRLETDLSQQLARCHEHFAGELQRASRDFHHRHDILEAEYKKLLADTKVRYEAEIEAVVREHEELVEEATREQATAVSDAEYDSFLDRQRARKEYEAQRQAAMQRYQQLRSALQSHEDHLAAARDEIGAVVGLHGCPLSAVEIAEQKVTTADALGSEEHYSRHVQAAYEQLRQFRREPPVLFVDQRWGILVFFLAALSLIYPLTVIASGQPLAVPAMLAVAIASALAIGADQIGRSLARRQAIVWGPRIAANLRRAETTLARAREDAKHQTQLSLKRLAREDKRRSKETESAWKRQMDDLRMRCDQRRAEVNDWSTKRQTTLKQQWADEVRPIHERYEPRLAALQHRFATATEELRTQQENQLACIRGDFQSQWQDAARGWQEGIQQFATSVDAMRRLCSGFDQESNPAEASHQEAPAGLSALRFGEFHVDLSSMQHGLSSDPRLEITPTRFSLPAVLSFPQAPSLLLKADADGRAAAIRVMQNVMVRLLTELPPGKVRFTIIDPIGLGQNFSAFMHLADYDERLVTNRIWTETAHINQRLADLTEHMENVIQTYLRNAFPSIQQYNQHAGEVAEPFHVLVVANFPNNFSEESARRLVSIASSGARCGVYTLVSVDTKMKLPRSFAMADLEACCNTVAWRTDHFCWPDDALREFSLQMDDPPDDAAITSALHIVGQRAKETSRVEVPFAVVSPERDDYWSGDSSTEIEVPLGRAGATKLQLLRLGRGTSQHVLVSGKTGSGKSTLLHALITNLALHYSPHEIQFYLVDFKKGVEFKPYSQQQLPHARVIAIESEREFGMSVLERLDVELRRRGDLFRRIGVQSLAGYRDARPDEVMPRVLLIIDEFQELFVKEDKIAQDAALLLDRLVRQGRAFGIHVMLGSQTLGGAYSLARSTIGQMAVRIALQCSAADAHLILSEENDAARLLRRPGEAIYNDANGLFEGNHPFQIVWLPDHEKETYLRQLRQLAEDRGLELERPIVFEGNVTADPRTNVLLGKALEAPAPEEIPLAPRAWLGEAIAIKEPPAIVFHRRTGSNLLLVGQREELALGVMVNCLIGLSAFSPQRGSESASRFYVLDGARPEASAAGFWSQLADSLPLDVRVARPREAADVVSMLAALLASRLQDEQDTGPAVLLLIHDLARFRDLQKSEDDFGLASLTDEQPPHAAGQLRAILRDGPAYGIHTLIWSDTYNNLLRWVDRQSLPDLEMRVLFQMGVTDSSHLMDSPAASHLGAHRAILYSEQQGRAERFRPYGPPSDAWLGDVQAHLRRRGGHPSDVLDRKTE